MNLKSQMRALNQPGENVQGLKGLIGWFNQSSLEQIQEFRRLEEWADYLKEQRESIREPYWPGQKNIHGHWTVLRQW
jgi:hypothetical protein